VTGTSKLADEAVKALAKNAYRRYAEEYHAEHLSWRDFSELALADLATLADQGFLNVYLAKEVKGRVPA
jgi:hypothetical protein